MQDDPVREALRAAAEANCRAGTGVVQEPCEKPGACYWCQVETAAAIAAFLRAPDVWRALAEEGTDAIAAAVERAAKEAGDGE